MGEMRPGRVRKQYKRDIFWIRDYVAYAATSDISYKPDLVRPVDDVRERCGTIPEIGKNLADGQITHQGDLA